MNRKCRRALLALPLLAAALGCGAGASQQSVRPGDGGASSDATAADAASPDGDGSIETSDADGRPTDASRGDTSTGGDANTSDSTDDASQDLDDASDAEANDDAWEAGPISCGETTSCASTVSLGTIQGGVPGGVNEQVGVEGDHSAWYQVEIDAYDPPSTNTTIGVSVILEPLAAIGFDIDVYLTQPPGNPGICAQPVGSSTSDAGVEQVALLFPNTPGKILGWITVHVTAVPGSQCVNGTTFWLDITAN